MISIVREDNTRPKDETPFLRISAIGNELTVSSRTGSATFPATVYEEGVLFIRTTNFRRVLRMTQVKEKFLAFQVTTEGLRFCDVLFRFNGADLVLFLKPSEAPKIWPPPRPDVKKPPKEKEPTLFPTDDID
jgi:hypothetical protein